jgi:hypothetical protein
MAVSLGCRLFFTLRVLVLSLLASCAQKQGVRRHTLPLSLLSLGMFNWLLLVGGGVGCAVCTYIDVSWREVRRTVNAAPICRFAHRCPPG